MKIIVGLGNPGGKYETTRHNAGFLAVDELARILGCASFQNKHQALIARVRLDDQQAILVKPQTFMNNSGRAVGAIVRDCYASIADVIVVHDELDLPFGVVRVKAGGGHGGHNGLRSILELVGQDFIRIRIGIGRPTPGADVADYVLRPFSADEITGLSAVVGRASEAAAMVVRDGATKAMNTFNPK